MLRIPALLLVVFVVAIAAVPDTWACSCGGAGTCPATGNLFPPNTVVFVGSLAPGSTAAPTSIPNFSGMSGPGMTFRVVETLKGTLGQTTLVFNAPGSCAYSFQAGIEYLIFASADTMMISPCAGIAPARQSASRIEQLRAARDARANPDVIGLVIASLPNAGTSYPLMNAALAAAKPVPEVLVVARTDAAEYRTRTAANGLYEFHGLPPGNYTVTIDPAGTAIPVTRGPSYTLRVNTGLTCRADFLSP